MQVSSSSQGLENLGQQGGVTPRSVPASLQAVSPVPISRRLSSEAAPTLDAHLDAHIRSLVSVSQVGLQSAWSWPPSDGERFKTCHGGSKAAVDICKSPSMGLYVKKYVSSELKLNGVEWTLEQGRLENDLKTYQQLRNMPLGNTFGGLYHETRSGDDGLVLYLEYAGSSVLANHVMSDSPEPLETMVSFFKTVAGSITEICAGGGVRGDELEIRRQLFLGRIVGRLQPTVDALAPMSNAVEFTQLLSLESRRWEILYARLEPLLMSGPVAALPTDTTFLNMILNPETKIVKCIDPGKIDTTAAAYPLSKMLVFGPYYRFINDKEFELGEEGFLAVKGEDVTRTARVLESCHGILEQLDPVTACQTVVAGLIQFGGDLGYRYNKEDIQSGKTMADLSLFSRALTQLEKLVDATCLKMELTEGSRVSAEQIDQFSRTFIGLRGNSLAEEVAMMLPVKEGL